MATATKNRVLQKPLKQTSNSTKGSRHSREFEGCLAFVTQLGTMAVAWRGNMVTRISIGHPSAAAALASLNSSAAVLPQDPPKFVQELAQRLQSYAAGETAATFGDVPLDFSHLSPFQKKVVDRCRRISAGGTRTYGELANLAGYPGAARAVGSVMSRNRYPIIIPCHRVVGSAGSLGGFSAPEGISLKARMLALEGAAIRQPKRQLRKAK